ncbi:MAG: dienelactone hydrolase family protein [Gammaproteobacteria bacterium]|nr:dienelactone hydrolase family protein [Gammaproteobacteria bacterium]MBA3730892.1 dienelactone hydrolase family protein [Gammaproteobacteria bacterium]
MSKKITFERPDGKQTAGYYVEAGAGEHAPGVVVIQEWWGLNDQIKGVADRLASQGYRVLVPDLYKGKVTAEEAEAEHLMGDLDFADAATQDVRGAVQYLKESSPKVAVMGFCMGGALTILAAVHVKEADAAVCWYGMPSEDAADVTTIAIPLQGHFAEHDEFFPANEVSAAEKKLKDARVKYEFHWYDAHHGFGNETLKPGNPNVHKLADHYDPEATKLAWRRTDEFLAKYVKA